jgi:hypothetical protein
MRIVPASKVRRHVARTDTGGKHGRPATIARVRDEPHVRIRLPLDALDIHEPADVGRVAAYAARKTPFPAVLASYGERACRRRITTLFVWNGNHRGAAARLRGDRDIDVLVPKTDWNRWRTCR